MSPSIDFSDVKGLEPIPVGDYLCSLVAAEETVSKAGNEMINLRWKVEEDEFEGRIIFDAMVFTEAAMFRVKQTLRGLGFPKNFAGEIDVEGLVGRTAMLLIDIENSTQTDDDGDPYPPRNRVKKVRQI